MRKSLIALLFLGTMAATGCQGDKTNTITVNPAPSVTISSPEANTTWILGNYYVVKWKFDDNPHYQLKYYADFYILPLDGTPIKTPGAVGTSFDTLAGGYELGGKIFFNDQIGKDQQLWLQAPNDIFAGSYKLMTQILLMDKSGSNEIIANYYLESPLNLIADPATSAIDTDRSPAYDVITLPTSTQGFPCENDFFMAGITKGTYSGNTNTAKHYAYGLSVEPQESPYGYDTLYDYCETDSVIREGYRRSDGMASYATATCPNGCSAGACIRPAS